MKTCICAKRLSSSTSIQYENMPLYKISILNSTSVTHKPNIYVKLSPSSKSGQHETDVWITLSSSSISIQHKTCVYTKWFSSSTSIQYQTCVYIQWPSSSTPIQNMHPNTEGSPFFIDINTVKKSAPLCNIFIYIRVIIMYIYHALINALSAHMIHINLNVTFYTHVKHSPTKTVYIKYYLNLIIIIIIIKTHYKHVTWTN